MDSSTWLTTSSLDLDLNLNSIRILDEPLAPTAHRHHHENVDEREREAHSITSGEGEVGSRNNSPRDETSALIEELNRVNAENKRLTEMLKVVCENYNALRRQFDYLSCIPPPATPSSNDQTLVAKKRKSGTGQGSNENNGSESSSSEENFISSKKQREETIIKAKITRVYVRTEASDSTLVVKDGYQWRKYGQKVTRDNPSPRAYFKCSFAPSCPVKKKVQRSVEDQTVVVATYEGEHNHPQPCGNQDSPTNRSNITTMSIGSMPTTLNSTAAPNTVTLDLTKSKPAGAATTPTSATAATPRINSPEFQSLMVEQMASSLTRDPNFTAALAAAISGRFLNQN